MRSTASTVRPPSPAGLSSPTVVTASRSAGSAILLSGSGSPGIRGTEGIRGMSEQPGRSDRGGGRWSPARASALVLVSPDQPGLLDHVVLDPLKQRPAVQPRLQIEVRVQRIHPEVVVMRAVARRGSRAVVAGVPQRGGTGGGL